MKISTTASSAIDEAQQYVDYSKSRLAIIRKHKKKLGATLDLLNRRFDSIGGDDSVIVAWTTVDVLGGTAGLEAHIRVQVDSMIEGVVPQILKAMLDMECDPVDSKDVTTTESASRTWRFKRATSEHFTALDVVVTADVMESDTGTCHKVQIGTKMVEVPEYKIECQGEQA